MPDVYLFLYGTLKRGQPSHEAFCQGYLSVAEAAVRGEIFTLPDGYPALVVPEEDMLATGTADPLADAALQERAEHRELPEPQRPLVRGELYLFGDPEARLPALDAFEGFRPGGESLYLRVLVPALAAGTVVPAWTYTMPGEPEGTPLPGGVWPP
ncbi:AIG2 family protein [Rubrobacter xylanophilus]|uniref:AIG2 family protein n=1 Tax=Rubrobacter xylanophilus TaxID=49319 RepID=A0A510HIR0_9ACTN|nr:gamma-glutamylcyclotransferase family protein [Rubrobacter xylanophilus]BBL79155.1 AIG2 family protein [Rubrobacter xylanophilus]